MLRALLLAAVACAVACTRPGNAAPVPRAEHGVLDLSGWQPERDGPVELSGDWLVHWGEALSPAELGGATPPRPVVVPTRWPAFATAPTTAAGYRAATYQLQLKLPPGRGSLMLSMGSANAVHRLWLDGELAAHEGRLGSSSADELPASGDYLVSIERQRAAPRLVLQVASHFTRTLWLRTAPLLGTPEQILDARAAIIAWPALLFGILCVAAMYHLGIYAVASQQTGQLVFGLHCLAVGVRQVLVGPHCVASMVFPELSFWFVVKLEYFCLYVAMYLGLALMRRLFPDELTHGSIRLWEVVGLLFSAASLVLSVPLLMRTLPAFQLCGCLAMCTVVARLLLAMRHGRPFARTILLCVVAYMAASVHDALITNGKIGAWAELSAPSLLLFLTVQAWALAKSYARSQAQVLALSRDLLQANSELTARNHELTLTNESVARFVPHEFLAQLNRRSIRDVVRGDHASRHMEVMFCDVRGFTGIVESMQPGEAFAFINDFLSFMEPAIHRHGGFINQYLGDCIMALFPNGADAAVAAALAMQEQLCAFNAEGRHTTQPVAVGIGINSGPLMLGTIGGHDRLDSGVVGDAVNLAARLEQLTKQYGATLLISELTQRRLSSSSTVELRLLDVTAVRGKRSEIGIYEVLDGLPEEARLRKLATRPLFERGVARAASCAWQDALDSFEGCLRMDPADDAALHHRRRCLAALGHGAWAGAPALPD